VLLAFVQPSYPTPVLPGIRALGVIEGLRLWVRHGFVVRDLSGVVILRSGDRGLPRRRRGAFFPLPAPARCRRSDHRA